MAGGIVKLTDEDFDRQAKDVTGLAKVKLMGADGMFSPDFVKAAGDAAVAMYHSSPDLSPEALGPKYEE